MEMAVRNTSRIKSLVLVSPAGISAPGVQPADTFLMSPEELVRAAVPRSEIRRRRASPSR